MSGHTYGQDQPSRRCPYCGNLCEADFVDVGVGFVQCGPYHCQHCGATEIGMNDDPRPLTAEETNAGWYMPGAEPGSSANVIGGKVVSHRVMREEYRAQFIDNPMHAVPGAVDAWRDKLRKEGSS